MKVELHFKNTATELPPEETDLLIKTQHGCRACRYDKKEGVFYDLEQGDGWDVADECDNVWWAVLDFELPEKLEPLLETPKPCPFCGGKPDIQPSNPGRQGNCWGRVKCKNIDCPTGGRLWVSDDIVINNERGSHHYINRAIHIWNTRFG